MICRASAAATESMVAYTNITSDVSLQIGREAETDGRVTSTALPNSSGKIKTDTRSKMRHVKNSFRLMTSL